MIWKIQTYSNKNENTLLTFYLEGQQGPMAHSSSLRFYCVFLFDYLLCVIHFSFLIIFLLVCLTRLCFGNLCCCCILFAEKRIWYLCFLRLRIYQLGLFLAMKKVHVSCVSCIPCVFDVCPPIQFMSLWVVWCIKSMHHTVHSTTASIGGSLEGVHRRKMNGPPEESTVINYSVEVPDQVQVKTKNATKEMQLYWENSRRPVWRSLS